MWDGCHGAFPRLSCLGVSTTAQPCSFLAPALCVHEFKPNSWHNLCSCINPCSSSTFCCAFTADHKAIAVAAAPSWKQPPLVFWAVLWIWGHTSPLQADTLSRYCSLRTPGAEPGHRQPPVPGCAAGSSCDKSAAGTRCGAESWRSLFFSCRAVGGVNTHTTRLPASSRHTRDDPAHDRAPASRRRSQT